MIGEEKGKKKEYKFFVQRADGRYIFKVRHVHTLKSKVASYPGPSHPGPGSHCSRMCEVFVRMYGTGSVNVVVNGHSYVARRQCTSVGSEDLITDFLQLKSPVK